MKQLFYKLALYRFFNAFILIFPAYTILMKDSGIPINQITILLLIWSLVALLFEVPSGAVADRVPRRSVMILGEIVYSLAFIVWLINRSFSGFAIGFIIWGIGSAMMSGTFDALVYDELKHYQKEGEYEKIIGRLRTVGSVGLVIALALGGFVAQKSYNLVLILSSLSPLIAALIIYTLKTVAISKSTEEVRYWQFLKETLKFSKSHLPVRNLLLLTAITAGVYSSADEMMSLIFNNLGLTLGMVGVIYAINDGIYGLSSSFSNYLFSKNPQAKYNLILLVGLLWLLIGIIAKPIMILIVLLATFFTSIFDVKFNTDLQNQIPSERRSTILSINSLLVEVVFMINILIIGFLVKKYDLTSSLYVFGGLVIVAVSIIFRPKKLATTRLVAKIDRDF